MNEQVTKHLIRVWDLPVRLFHWLLVVLMLVAFMTGQIGGGFMPWHGRLGLAIVGLLAFRLVWGVIGSPYARFENFLPWPGRVRDYLRGRWTGLGHNPLGALSVLALLGLMGLQTVTGLFANDDIAFQGPLASLVNAETSQWLTRLHRLNVGVIIVLVGLHITAILFYTIVKKESLVLPMITGMKKAQDIQVQTSKKKGGGGLAFIVAVTLALAVVAIASGVFIEPSLPSPQPAPEW